MKIARDFVLLTKTFMSETQSKIKKNVVEEKNATRKRVREPIQLEYVKCLAQ